MDITTTMLMPSAAAVGAAQALDQMLAAAAQADDLGRYGLYLDSETVCHGRGGNHLTDDGLDDWLLAALFVQWVRDYRAKREHDASVQHRRNRFYAIKGARDE